MLHFRYCTRRHAIAAFTICTALAAAACNKESKSPDAGAAPGAERTHADNDTSDGKGTGRVIVVMLSSDSSGNYFKPSEIDAKRGDVVRFTNRVGVHNVAFVADSNPGKSGLPPASEMLQLPDQTYDVKVTFGDGRYYFQCDPHALLGMKGHITVTD